MHLSHFPGWGWPQLAPSHSDRIQPAGPTPSDPPVTWCRNVEPGAHHECCPLLQALFITAKALPVATTTTVVSTMNTVFIGDLALVPQRMESNRAAHEPMLNEGGAVS